MSDYGRLGWLKLDSGLGTALADLFITGVREDDRLDKMLCG